MKYFKDNYGFTLIEIMIVIAIVSILSGIVIIKTNEQVEYARGAKIVADMKIIENAVALYYLDNGNIPKTIVGMTTDVFSPNLHKHDLVPNYIVQWSEAPIGNLRFKCPDGKVRVYNVEKLNNSGKRNYYAWNSQKAPMDQQVTFLQNTAQQYLTGEGKQKPDETYDIK